jgi:predicted dehydrogenase/NAD(P)-dependent dehydrogenase (short-subunit alcohol dehydrogenase family)
VNDTAQYETLFSCQGRTAVVTGAGGLIGRELCAGLRTAGADVWAADVAGVQEGTTRLSLDITSEESVVVALDRVIAEAGRLDILVNCAYPRTADWGVPLEDEEFSSWLGNVDSHLGGYFLTSREAAKRMAARGGGSIVNFASIYGIVGPSYEIYGGTEMTTPTAYAGHQGRDYQRHKAARHLLRPLRGPLQLRLAWRCGRRASRQLHREVQGAYAARTHGAVAGLGGSSRAPVVRCRSLYHRPQSRGRWGLVGAMRVPAAERVLVAGSGSIAQRHVRNLLGMGVAEVIAVTARDVTGVEGFADPRVSVTRTVPRDCPATAIVANDTDRHVATARELVGLGAHVLVEKPVAPGLSPEFSRLCDDVRDSGLVGRVAYNLRFLGALAIVSEALGAGALGQVLFARIEVGQWLPDWRPDRPFASSYSASVTRGGGVALDLSHEVDYMVMLFGLPLDWCVREAHTGALAIESPDVFDGIYSFSDRSTCTVHLDYLEKKLRRGLRIVGTDGVLDCDIAAGHLSLDSARDVRDSSDPLLFDREGTFVDELELFFSEVAGVGVRGPRLPGVEEGSDVLRLLSNDGDAHDGSRPSRGGRFS